MLQDLGHRSEGVGVGGLEAAHVVGAAADGHSRMEAIVLPPGAPGFQQVVGRSQLAEPSLDVCELVGRRGLLDAGYRGVAPAAPDGPAAWGDIRPEDFGATGTRLAGPASKRLGREGGAPGAVSIGAL